MKKLFVLIFILNSFQAFPQQLTFTSLISAMENDNYEFQGHLLDKGYEYIASARDDEGESWAFDYENNRATIWVYINEYTKNDIRAKSIMIHFTDFGAAPEVFDYLENKIKSYCKYEGVTKSKSRKDQFDDALSPPDNPYPYYQVYIHSNSKTIVNISKEGKSNFITFIKKIN